MNETKTFYPYGLIIVGLIGIFFLQSLIIFDGGLYSDMNLPESSYTNDSGDSLYTFAEVHEHITFYAQSRARLWALDILSVYLFVHGVFSVLIRRNELGRWFKTSRSTLSFLIRTASSIILGLGFWFVMIRISMNLDMPLH